jgi:hypothetical protein
MADRICFTDANGENGLRKFAKEVSDKTWRTWLSSAN